MQQPVEVGTQCRALQHALFGQTPWFSQISTTLKNQDQQTTLQVYMTSLRICLCELFTNIYLDENINRTRCVSAGEALVSLFDHVFITSTHNIPCDVVKELQFQLVRDYPRHYKSSEQGDEAACLPLYHQGNNAKRSQDEVYLQRLL